MGKGDSSAVRWEAIQSRSREREIRASARLPAAWATSCIGPLPALHQAPVRDSARVSMSGIYWPALRADVHQCSMNLGSDSGKA
jgi:hypothetical protein